QVAKVDGVHGEDRHIQQHGQPGRAGIAADEELAAHGAPDIEPLVSRGRGRELHDAGKVDGRHGRVTKARDGVTPPDERCERREETLDSRVAYVVPASLPEASPLSVARFADMDRYQARRRIETESGRLARHLPLALSRDSQAQRADRLSCLFDRAKTRERLVRVRVLP